MPVVANIPFSTVSTRYGQDIIGRADGSRSLEDDLPK